MKNPRRANGMARAPKNAIFSHVCLKGLLGSGNISKYLIIGIEIEKPMPNTKIIEEYVALLSCGASSDMIIPQISDVKNTYRKNKQIVNEIGSRANPSAKLDNPIPRNTKIIIGFLPTLSAKKCIIIEKKYPVEAIASMKSQIELLIIKSACT